MNPIHFVPLLIGSVGLLAQEPKCPRSILPATPAKVAPAPDAPVLPTPNRNSFLPAPAATAPLDTMVTPALPVQRGVLFDQVDGVLWAAGDAWKASFDAKGVTFVPFLGSDAPRNYPTRFDLTAVTIGGHRQPAAPATLARAGNTAVLERGTLREEYVASDAGIEQRFVFRELPQRGAIDVDLVVTTEFAIEANANGHTFTHERGSFGYGAAVAIDARGESTPVATTYAGGHFHLTVPASFVERAQLPLVIDPLIGNTVWSYGSAPVSADLAYDATLHLFVLCYVTQFSATDFDVHAQARNEDFTPNGMSYAIDLSFTSWSKARIANLNAYDRFLIVAECGTAPRWIGGRTFTPSGPWTGPQFPVVQNAWDNHDPDIGGDPSLQTPTYFTVVFESDITATDHDIEYVQVQQDSVVRGGPVAIEASLAFEHSPRISKSNGQGPAGAQDWVVAYRRTSGSNAQTRMGALTWDGQRRSWNGAFNVPVTMMMPAAGLGGLAVSSPTDAVHGQRYAIVDTVLDAAHGMNKRLHGSAVDRFGNIYATSMLTDATIGDEAPVVDTDGGRFVLGWLDGNPGTFTVGTFDLVGADIVPHEVVPVGQGSETSTSLVAMHTGGGGSAYDREYGLAWTGVPTTQVFLQRYRGIGVGGVGFRSTGCGPLSWSVTGLGAIGTSMQFQLTGGAGFTGWAFGSTVFAPLPQCPGCVVGSTADLVLLGSWLTFAIPFQPNLVGLQYSMQGFDFGPGPCLGALWLSDTADLTIR